MAEDGRVVFRIVGDASQAERAIDQFERRVRTGAGNIDDTTTRSGSNMRRTVENTMAHSQNTVAAASKRIAGLIGAAFSVKKIVEFGKQAIEVASDLNEVQNVVDTTFGEGSSRIDKWAMSAAEAFGESELQAKQFTSTIGAMFKSMGIGQQEMEDMSIGIAGLAGDMASFYNLDPSEAFEKLRAGISGETEPLKQLGINMSVANLEAYALSQGITTAYDSMTQAEQATLRYQYIMQATADAQGDFAKTSDSYANQVRILQLEIQTLSADIGNGLMPIAQELVGWAREGISWFSQYSGGITNFANTVMDALSPIVEDIVPRLANIIASIAPILQPIAELIGTIAQFVSDKLAAALDFIAPLISEVVDILSGYIDTLVSVYEAIFEFADSVYQKFEPALDVIMDIAGDLIDFFSDIVDFVGDVISGFIDWGTAADGAGGYISDLADVLNETLVPILKFVGDTIKWLIGLFESIIEKVRDFLEWLGILDEEKPALDKSTVTQEDIIKNGAYHMEYETDETGKQSGYMVVDWDKAEQMNQDGTWVSHSSNFATSRHQSGEDFVMSDWTPAFLDYGERVLTRQENMAYTAMGGVDGMARASESTGATAQKTDVDVKLGFTVSPREMAHAITPYVIDEMKRTRG